MIPGVVVDVGNTRIKWGRCAADSIAEMASLPHHDEIAWQKQFEAWRPTAGLPWVLSGTQPTKRDRLREWLERQDCRVVVIDDYRQLTLAIDVEFPERVGLDRLLNAVAVNAVRRQSPAVIIDAGTAVTVDQVDAGGVFRGGAIMPGLRLMAVALHHHTALLPRVDDFHEARLHAKNTADAMRAGMMHAVVGGIERLGQRQSDGLTEWFVTGGDGALLASQLGRPVRVWPEMTLEGIRRTVLER